MIEQENIEIDWRELTIENKELIDSYYKFEDSRSCEFTFANNWLWAPHYEIRFSIIEGMLVFVSDESHLSVSFPRSNVPMEEEHVKQVILLLRRYFEQKQMPFKMHLVSEAQFGRLEKMFPGEYQISYSRDEADYVYEREKLATLAGKKLHGKRNHVNRFIEEYPDWSYETIIEQNQEECVAMAKHWRELSGCDDDLEKSAELCVTLRALKNMKRLQLQGGLIRAKGEVVAFSIGEPCNSDTFVVHIEKAYGEIQGAYPMINQQFVIHETEGFTYINREEDTGAEGLRKAKLSYYPVFMVEKGLVTLK